MAGRLPCGRPARVRGMTLLEIMVVIVIIAVLISVAVISLGDNTARQLDEEARRVRTLIRLAADDAVLQGREIGLSIDKDNYRFLVYDDRFRGWQSLTQESIFRPRQLPDGISLELFLDDQELVLPTDESLDEDSGDSDDEEGEAFEALPPPQILMLSSGEMTPFELVLEHEQGDLQIVLRGFANGFLEESVERL